MSKIEQLHKAEAAAREALVPYAPVNDYINKPLGALRDLLAALDAARGEAVCQRASTIVKGAWIDVGEDEAKKHEATGYPMRRLYAAPPAALAVPEDAIEAAYWDFDARHKGYGPHKTTPQSERDAFKWAVRAMLAAANKENNRE